MGGPYLTPPHRSNGVRVGMNPRGPSFPGGGGKWVQINGILPSIHTCHYILVNKLTMCLAFQEEVVLIPDFYWVFQEIV